MPDHAGERPWKRDGTDPVDPRRILRHCRDDQPEVADTVALLGAVAGEPSRLDPVEQPVQRLGIETGAVGEASGEASGRVGRGCEHTVVAGCVLELSPERVR